MFFLILSRVAGSMLAVRSEAGMYLVVVELETGSRAMNQSVLSARVYSKGERRTYHHAPQGLWSWDHPSRSRYGWQGPALALK